MRGCRGTLGCSGIFRFFASLEDIQGNCKFERCAALLVLEGTYVQTAQEALMSAC